MGFPKQEYWSGVPLPSVKYIYGFKLNSGSIYAKTVKKHRMLTCNVFKYPFWINRGKSKRSLQFSALYFKECDKLEK